MTDNTIFVSLGKKRYVGGTVTELTGKDISADTFTVALGTGNEIPPATGWVAPSVNTAGTTPASRVLKLLIDNSFALGTFWCWGNIIDSPEIEPVVLSGPHVLA